MPHDIDTPTQFCCLEPEHDPPPPLSADAGDPARFAALRLLANKWDNGVTLTYAFLDDGPGAVPGGWRGRPEDIDVVRRAFTTWKQVGIGLSFREVADSAAAIIRIGFAPGDGSWSYVGTASLARPVGTRTMNFGWSLLSRGGFDTALHEIGHALGMPHEHQNANAGVEWDEEAVYAALASPPNSWSRQRTYDNILRKLDPRDVEGSVWDPDSIMHYPFAAGLIRLPEKYRGGLRPAGGLSALDIAWVRRFYPPVAAPLKQLVLGKLAALAGQIGSQVGFEFVPTETRPYRLRTHGFGDRQLSIVEQLPGGDDLLKSDDDSGQDRNAALTMELIRGRHYKILVSTRYRPEGAANALSIE